MNVVSEECIICQENISILGFKCKLCTKSMCKVCTLSYFRHQNETLWTMPRCPCSYCSIFVDSIKTHHEEIFSILYKKCKHDRIILTGNINLKLTDIEKSNITSEASEIIKKQIMNFRNMKIIEFNQMPLNIITCGKICQAKKYNEVLSESMTFRDYENFNDLIEKGGFTKVFNKLSNLIQDAKSSEMIRNFEENNKPIIPLDFDMSYEELPLNKLNEFIEAYDTTICSIHNYRTYVENMNKLTNMFNQDNISYVTVSNLLRRVKFM